MKIYLSIIVPVYNVEPYLHKCINSLLQQDLNSEQYEIIIVDDGSTDNSGRICDTYKKDHSNIHIYHKENGGLSDARNFGCRKALGRYVLFVDADDYIQENVLGTILKECKNQGFPQIMFLQAKKVYSEGRIAEYDKTIDNSKLQGNKNKVLNYLAKRTMYPASAWSKMIERNFLNKNNINFKVGQFSEDYEWTLTLLMKADKFGCYNGDYYYYRQNRKGSITDGVTEKHFRDLINIIENMERMAISAENQKETAKAIYSFAAYVYRVLLWYGPDYYKKYKIQIDKKRYLLSKKQSIDIKILRGISSLIGIGKTIKLLNIYGKVREVWIKR